MQWCTYVQITISFIATFANFCLSFIFTDDLYFLILRFFLFRLCWCYYWIIYFKIYIHKSMCILSIIAHSQSFCCEYFFLLRAWEVPKLGLYSHLLNWINPFRSTCRYKWALSAHSSRESVTFPTYPTSPQKRFFFTLSGRSIASTLIFKTGLPWHIFWFSGRFNWLAR